MDGQSPTPSELTAAPAAEIPEAVAPVPTSAPRQPPARFIPDPDLDGTLNENTLPYDGSPELYLRLVANPFLAALGLLGWVLVMGMIIRGGPGPYSPLAALLTLASLALLPRLLHYHCLDCGRTGQLTAWRRHVCPGVVARRFDGRDRRFRGPTPYIQVLLWLWLCAALLVIWQVGVLRR